MRNVAALGLLIGMLMFASAATAGEPIVLPGAEPIGVQYVWSGPMGSLSIANSNGLPFVARAVNGVPVAQGVVIGPLMTLAVSNFGQLADGTVLVVDVGSVQFRIKNDDWIWL